MTMNSMAPPLGSVAGAADLQMQLELLGHRQPGRAPLLHARFDARPGAFGEVGDVVRLAGVDVQVEVAVDADALEVQRADARGAPSTVDDGDRAGPAGGGAADLHRETGDREAVAGQRLEVVQLLEVAVADLAPGLVPLPDQRGVAGLLEFRLRMNERRVPRPGVGARHAHAALEQVQRRLPAHARARRHVVGLAVGRARARVDDDDVERTQRVADALQLRLHVLRRHHVAVGPGTEVELHTGLEAPLEWPSSIVIARSPRFIVDAKWYGASRWVPLWVMRRIHSMAQPSASGSCSSFSPGKNAVTSFAVSRWRRYSIFGP